MPSAVHLTTAMEPAPYILPAPNDRGRGRIWGPPVGRGPLCGVQDPDHIAAFVAAGLPEVVPGVGSCPCLAREPHAGGQEESSGRWSLAHGPTPSSASWNESGTVFPPARLVLFGSSRAARRRSFADAKFLKIFVELLISFARVAPSFDRGGPRFGPSAILGEPN